MNNEDLTIELYKTIKLEDMKKASDEGDLLMYFNRIVKKIFPSTKAGKEVEKRKSPVDTPQPDSVRIGEF